VKELRSLTPEELSRAEAWLRNPPPGSRAAAARDYGVDLTLLIFQLRLTPAERVRNLEQAAPTLEQVRGAARKRR
jgi:hypothetical protein